MAFKVDEVSETSHAVVLGETLWLKADSETVVPDGHPEAAFLLGTAGQELSRQDAARYGLIKASKAEAATAGETKPAQKQQVQAANKQRERSSDK